MTQHRKTDNKTKRTNPLNSLSGAKKSMLRQTCVAVPNALLGVTLMLPAAAFTVALLPGVALAQNSNATIRGQVLDATGAIIPGANVVITNQDTNVVVFKGQSDSAGAFVAPQVLPGTYKLTVDAAGLKQSVVRDLVATIAQVASVDVTLQVGSVNEVVTVAARGEQLDTSTSNISTVIAPQEVQNIPILGRAPENLLAFIPGVTHGGAADSINTSQLSINGSRTLNTEVLLNGVSVIIASTGAVLALPSPDGIDELRFLTSNAPAEYGRTSGAVLAANTISGTNKYHGNAYFLFRNDRLDANTYFHKLSNTLPANLANPAYVQQKANRDRFFQMGGSFGGAVRIPHVYDGRGKTFFFVNYDRTLQSNPSTLTLTVPDAAKRTGNFAGALPVYQPGGTATPQYANNQVTNIDPAAAKILALLPLPNTQGTFDAANNRFINNLVEVQAPQIDNLRLAARVDEQLTAKDRISAALYRFRGTSPNPVYYNSALLNSTFDCACSNAYVPSIDYTRTWNPTLVTDLNMGFFRYGTFRNPPGLGLGVSQQTGIASLPLDQLPEMLFSTGNSATGGSYSNIGSDPNTRQSNITNTFAPYGTLTKTMGAHTLRAGASLRKNQFNSYNPAGSPNGELDFDGTITNHGATGNATTQLADFLTGNIKVGSYQLPQPATGRRNFNLAAFLQDDYKVTSKLTVNLGLRYDYESPLTISNNLYSRVDEATGTLLVAGQNASPSLNIVTPKTNFSPRVGLAYSPTSKTVIRAAYGDFYGTIFQNLGGQIAFPGFDVTQSYLTQGSAVPQPFKVSQGLPLTAVRNLANPSAAFNAGTPGSPYTITGNQFGDLSHLPLTQQYNVGVQQQLPLNLTLEINYVGNHSVHLPTNYPVNFVPLAQADAVTLANNTTATQSAKPFPNISSFNETSDGGDSKYNSLQITVKRQFNTSLALLSNYTWAKGIDDASTIYNFSAPNGTANAQFPGDPKLRNADRAVSNIDVKHTLNIAIVYTTMGPRWLRGFRISPVFVGHTGLPLNVTQTNLIPNAGQQRPNGDTSGLKVQPYVNGTAIQYLLPATATNFPLTPSGPVYSTIAGVRTRIVNTGLGTTSRDSLRAPSEVDFDASISKDFPLYERLKFNLRVDAFNVINHTNFAFPAAALSVTATGTTATFATNSPNFGKITSTQPPRTLQVSGRFTF